MARRRSLAALVGAVMLLGMLPGLAAAVPPPVPASMAAVGDSITQAASTGGSLGADYPQNSWSTGTNATVNSHYQRLLALNPAIQGNGHNLSVSGAKMADLATQMQQAAALQVDYVTVLIGGNDICTDTEAQMTPVADFRSQFEAAMTAVGSTQAEVYVVSIPRVLGLWELFKNNWWARFVWNAGNICQSLLENPTSTKQADVKRRERVAQRNVDYNQALFEVCLAAPSCHWDGWAVYNTPFTSDDVSADYFHPSIQGQAKLASVTWAAGLWPDGAPPPPPENEAPTASFTWTCTDLDCTFNGGGSTDPDGTLVSHAWTFGSEGTGSGVTADHTFSSAGTHHVTLLVTDDEGATGTVTQPVTVSAPQPPPPAGTVSLAGVDGLGEPRKGGWAATVTVTVVDGNGAAVADATVSGSWSSGGTSTCTTDAAGICTASSPMKKRDSGVTWSVSGITHATLVYDPAANAVAEVVIAQP